MTRVWRLASGLAVLLMALFFSASLVLNLTLGERPLPGVVYPVLLPIVACVVLFLSFANDARKSKKPTTSIYLEAAIRSEPPHGAKIMCFVPYAVFASTQYFLDGNDGFNYAGGGQARSSAGRGTSPG
jgi:glucan phosphoethanolaminetransferase (alkaline phosphatase superfamily)